MRHQDFDDVLAARLKAIPDVTTGFESPFGSIDVSEIVYGYEVPDAVADDGVYIVYETIDDTGNDAYDAAATRLVFRVHVWVKRGTGAGVSLAQELVDGVYGQFPDTVTSGLQRWKPADTNGWRYNHVRHTGTQTVHEESWWHYAMDFEILVSKS